jgi:hypothetical protein
MRLKFHLPKAVACGDIAYRSVEIGVVAGENVRNQVDIVFYLHRSGKSADPDCSGFHHGHRVRILPEAGERIEETACGRHGAPFSVQCHYKQEAGDEGGN